MPQPRLRLLAVRDPDVQTVRFSVLFAATSDDATAVCAPAQLSTGDGESYDLGLLCAPTAVTWREARATPLITHRYGHSGPFVAELRWGDAVYETTVAGREAARTIRRGPLLSVFALIPVAEHPFERLVKFRVDGLIAGQQVRLDGGAGQVRVLPAAGAMVAAELGLTYAKPGAYIVMLDVLDAEGFWLTTVAQSPLELTDAGAPQFEPARAAEALEPAPERAVIEAEPWLPYRNFKALRSGVRTYTRPGGGSVSRVVSAGVWLTARAETVAAGQRWFQTAGGDWVLASDVTFFEPATLRGLVLAATQPPTPPQPPAPPATERRAVITASTLNVRARPGLIANNPPIATLRAGMEVQIFEETRVDGAVWYRIGEGRWIHGGYVRLLGATEPTPPPPTGQVGVVMATTLNVRARPGVSANNPPIAVLRSGATVTIHEERRVDGEPWYRIGENRWCAAQWIRLQETASRAIGGALEAATARLPFGWVVPEKLSVYARPSTAADNAPVRELGHYAVVRVLEEQTTGGQSWLRIGENEWVDGRSVGVARFRQRPASIGVDEKWVAVCLAEQTLVAYEGDLPVFAALVSTGAGGTPTVQGIFRTWRRLPTGKMSGPGYYIEDVTWTCYFYSGYALHTAYWHDKFGTVRSHGCVNMTPYDAWWVYQWSASGGANSPTVYVYWA